MENKEIQELVGALEMMYDQYCDRGHIFMSAGENASEILSKYGYEFDSGGRMTKRP